MSNIKQVIVMRNDLNMRKGKMCAQAAHACMGIFLRRDIEPEMEYPTKHKHTLPEDKSRVSKQLRHQGDMMQEWISTGMAKICVRVDSEKELMEVFVAAKKAGISVYKVTDAGKTEFNGVPTITCIAIGPDKAEEIDKITGGLKLL